MIFWINLMRDCLFGPFQQLLDLDTGEPISIQFYPEEVQEVKNGLHMPLYTNAPICQSYLSMLESQLGIVSNHDFSKYPVFQYTDDIHDPIVASFVDEAWHYFEEIDWMLLRDRESDSPQYDTKFPTFIEYFNCASLEVTKDWCSKAGLEWCESMPDEY